MSRPLFVTAALLLGVMIAPPPPAARSAVVVPTGAEAAGQGFNLNPSDLKFILQQIKIAEAHAAAPVDPADPCKALRGGGPAQIPTDPQGAQLPWGLRTVDGTCNNLVPGQAKFGSASQEFPRSSGTDFREADVASPGFPNNGSPSSYARAGNVVDAQPRIISNLIVDQTSGNKAAVAAAGEGATPDPTSGTLFIQNVAPDVGLSAPFNSWFTLFGQFFDHGLDLVGKGGGVVFMPLAADDPLYASTPAQQRFMVLTRSTGSPGEATNKTATFVDQSQTYTSHPAHQVFLREYADNAAGRPASTGRMLEGRLADGTTAGMGTWAATKDQARRLLGIGLDDLDALDVPLVATDPYGKFLPGPARGLPQLVVGGTLIEGDRSAPVDATAATRTGHAFLDDIAHTAVPHGDHDGDRTTPPRGLTPDEDSVAGGPRPALGFYDDELLEEHFVAGDGRVNENIGLTAVHHVFHAEHNRLAADSSAGGGSIKDVLVKEDPASVKDWQISPGVWNGERIFQAARFVTEMEYQHLAFEEFARKVQPMINPFGAGGSGYDSSVNAAIRAEFAHAVYRFGHSMLTETVARREANGDKSDLPLLDAFLNPLEYDEAGTLSPDAAAGRVIRGMTRQPGNEIDEFVVEALRNKLLGLPLDLAAINIARARETGVPRLNAVRAKFYEASNNSALRPYTSWADFGFGLKHRESLLNFVAAYGRHPSIDGTMAARRTAAKRLIANDPIADPATPADAGEFLASEGAWASGAAQARPTGIDDVDLWVGGLAEKQAAFGGLLGSTFNYVFELQMEDLQFGDRFYYLARTAGLNLLTQLEGNSFAELMSRNTDVTGLPADAFSRPDYVFDVGNLMSGTSIADDPGTPDYDEGERSTEPGMHLSRVPAGTLRYTGPAHTVFNGSAGDDRVWAGEGDDTIRGNEGNDWMQGGDGLDNLIGGPGDDLLNDLSGDDTLKGGDGDDALSSGQGFGGDLNQGGRGKDYIIGGNDGTETFGGPGNDFVYAGDGTDTVFGDDGDDWIEGGKGPFNLLQGDSGAPFQNDPNTPGHDVLDGDGGEQDFDSEGGDDIMLGGPGIQRAEGMLGFDWFSHKGDPHAGGSDMNLTGALPPSVEVLRDRFDLVEGLSGWNQDDVLRGDSRTANGIVAVGDQPIAQGHAIDQAGIDRIAGLQDVLGPDVNSFSGGNIILGGNGSDILEGRGGDDIIDGDKWLNVRLSVRDASGNELRSADNIRQLQADVFAGVVDPGDIVIVREVLDGAGGGTDTAVFSDFREAYACADASGPLAECPTDWAGGRITVTHSGDGPDGSDVLTAIEKLVFADSVAPAAPEAVTATAGNQSAVVSFLPPATAVDRFEIRVLGADGTQLGELRVVADPDASSFLVTGLTNGQPVSFQVRAVNGFGASPFSDPSTPVTPAPTPPATPEAPSATAGDRQAQLTWTAPANGGSSIVGYDVRLLNQFGDVVGALRPTTGTSLTVTGLDNGTPYTFQVRARNSQGSSPFSAESNQVVPRGRSGAPVIGRAEPRSSSALLRWTAPADDGGSAITAYRVQIVDAAGRVVGEQQVNSAATQLLVTGLINGRDYRFQVRSTNAVGNSAYSGLSNVVRPLAPPSTPRIGTASSGVPGGTATASMRWSAATGTVTGYRVMVVRYDTSGRIVSQVMRGPYSAATRTRAFALTPGRYRFRVQAFNTAALGSWSSSSNLVIAR